jgi:hypothetical protein
MAVDKGNNNQINHTKSTNKSRGTTKNHQPRQCLMMALDGLFYLFLIYDYFNFILIYFRTNHIKTKSPGSGRRACHHV